MKIQNISYDQEGIVSILNSFESTDESTIPQTPNLQESKRGIVFLFDLLNGKFLSVISVDNSISNDLQIKDSNGEGSIIHHYLDTVDIPIGHYLEEINIHFNKKKTEKHDIIRKIISFESLRKNWDGYGAYPLEIESASNAIKFINLLDNKSLEKLEDVFPNPNGTISFLWENDLSEKLSLEIGNNSFSYYLKLSSQPPIFYDNLEINSQQVKKVSDFIRFL